MGYLDPYKDDLAEIFQRRNLIVDNGSVVHSVYLNKVSASLRIGVKVGDELKVTPEYLEAAIDRIEVGFILIAAELWKKLDAGDERRATTLNDDIVMPRLAEGRWTLQKELVTSGV